MLTQLKYICLSWIYFHYSNLSLETISGDEMAHGASVMHSSVAEWHHQVSLSVSLLSQFEATMSF